jgi:hypothetical protein
MIVLIVLAAVVVAIAALVGLQLPELRRYMKMRKM